MNTNGSEIDVLVLGAGPAGCATALSLRRLNPSLRVVLVEKADYSTIRVGETLPPAIQPLLVELGVWDQFRRQAWVEAFGTSAVWGSTSLVENEFIYSPYGKGWHVDRRLFDAMLTSVAGESGAAVLLNSEVSEARWFADHWRIKVRTRNKNGQNFRTRFVVDATGRTASFAKHQGAQPLLLDKLVGSFVFFALSPNTPPPDTYTLVEACEHGWWYVALLPDARLVAAFFSDADIIQTHRLHSFAPWYALLQETSYARVRLATAAPLGEPRVYVAWSQHLDRVYGEGWLAVGDTVSTFDPLSSQGIFKALRSGIYASRAIHDWLGGETRRRDRYQALMQEEFTEYLDIRAAYYRQEQRWAAAAFWRRRHEVISLAPTQILQRIEQQNDTRAIRRGTTGLSETALVLLLALCTNPRTASEIVTLFQRQMPGVASDRRVILALQRLCEAGLIWSADESNRTFTTP